MSKKFFWKKVLLGNIFLHLFKYVITRACLQTHKRFDINRRHEQRRLDEWTTGTTEATLATPEASHRPPRKRSSGHGKWGLMGVQWQVLRTGAIWPIGQPIQPLSSVERSRGMGSGAVRTADAERLAGRIGLGDPFLVHWDSLEWVWWGMRLIINVFW